MSENTTTLETPVETPVESETKPAPKASTSKNPPTVIGGEEFDLPSDTSTALKNLAGRTLSTDSQGIDRVVSNHVPDWKPSPFEPDPDEVARCEEANRALEAHQEERRALLGLRAGV